MIYKNKFKELLIIKKGDEIITDSNTAIYTQKSMVSLKHKRILFISNKIKKQHQGGREKLTYLNIKIIKELFNENFFLYEVKKKK